MQDRSLRLLILCLAGVICSTATALAQNSTVVPFWNTASEGNSANDQPFGSDRMHHTHYIGNELLSKLPSMTSIKSISYRRDGQIKSPALLKRIAGKNPKVKPLWTVRLGNDPRTGSVNPPPFKFPTAKAMTTVINAVAFDFPDLPLPTSGPAAFSIQFMFAQPFVYNSANQTKKPHLIIDHFVYQTQNQNYIYYLVDAAQGSPQEPARAVLTNPTSFGCPKGQNRATGLATGPGGGNLDFYLLGAPAKTQAWACLGSSSKSWGGIPLPLDLGSLGLPGCRVYNDLAVVIPKKTSTSGSATFSVKVPNKAYLKGQSLHGQWVVRDTRVNKAFTYATSDSLKWTLPNKTGNGALAMGVTSYRGGNGRQANGFVMPNRGPIVQINW